MFRIVLLCSTLIWYVYMYMYVTCCVAGHTHLLFIGYAKLTSAKQIVSNNISDTL